MQLVEIRDVNIDAAREKCRGNPAALAVVEMFEAGKFEEASRAAGNWNGPTWSALPHDMVLVFDEMGLGASYVRLDDVKGGEDGSSG